jgi:hypothetical protein
VVAVFRRNHTALVYLSGALTGLLSI